MVQVKRGFLHCLLFNVPPATWVLCATLWHSNNFNPLSCGWVGYLFMDSLPPPLTTLTRWDVRGHAARECSRITRVNLWNSSRTSTTQSRKEEGFIRTSASNSFQAMDTELWLVQQGIHIQRDSFLSSFTTLKDCEPPFTCITTVVRPCVGRTDPVFNSSQSIWFLKTLVTVPCISGETQTCPSLQCDNACSS